MTYRLSAADLSPASTGNLWQRVQIPGALGIGYADRLQLDDGLTIACSHYRPRHDLHEQSIVDRESQSLVITLAMGGVSTYRHADGSEFTFKAGHTTVTAFGQTRGERLYRAEQEVHQVRLIVDHCALRKYALEGLIDGLPGDKPASQLFHGSTAGASKRLAADLARLHANGGGLLDIQIAALTLLAEQSRGMVSPPEQRQALRLHDQERMLQARDILMQQFDRQLSVAYLCAAVGVNEFKFKQAFRDMFGTSPHRMLSEIRMRKAWELLRSGEQAASVGYKVGFQHPSSFSAAFQRFYGRTPKSIATGPAQPQTRSD